MLTETMPETCECGARLRLAYTDIYGVVFAGCACGLLVVADRAVRYPENGSVWRGYDVHVSSRGNAQSIDRQTAA